jgi:ABC-type transporter Mla subunit MlaD
LGVIVGFGAFVVLDLQSKPPLVRVGFPGISTLSSGDPVVEDGVEVGLVQEITLVEGVAVTTLRLYRHRDLPEDTRFFNLSHSLMGARKVWIVPGKSPRALDPGRVQAGIFVPGLTETLHKATALTALVARLRVIADSLLFVPTSGVGQPQNAVALMHHLEKATAVLGKLSASLAEAETGLKVGLEGLQSATALGDTVAVGVRRAGPQTEAAMAKAEGLLTAFARIEAPLESALTTVERLATLIADSTGAGRVFNREDEYRALLKSVDALDSMAQALRQGGLGDDLKIKPRLRKGAP